ncbi:MAG: DUF547 domain-containing protein, partial [Marivirga sp.]|nr:DUF547 domain-containing protein [Marivirga sp.]
MKGIFLFLFILRLSVVEATDLKTFTSDANVFFAKYVENGSVAYSKIKSQISDAGNLYKQLGEMSLVGCDDNAKKAFYINAYNIIVIYWVAKHYPLRSPLDNSGFFDKVKHAVAGEPLTLNALEIKKLLQPYKDARFHFALACAAKSCPPLASFSYTPEKVDQQLDERTILALNDKEWIKVYPNQKRVELSKIFEWYKVDFNADGQSSIEWLNKYRKEKVPNTYSVG